MIFSTIAAIAIAATVSPFAEVEAQPQSLHNPADAQAARAEVISAIEMGDATRLKEKVHESTKDGNGIFYPSLQSSSQEEGWMKNPLPPDVGILRPSDTEDQDARDLSSTECPQGFVDCNDGYEVGTGVSCQAACNGQCCTGTSQFGSDPCVGFTGKICKDGTSCKGSSACRYAIIASVVNSCSGDFTCEFTEIGRGKMTNCCNADYACDHMRHDEDMTDCCNTEAKCQTSQFIPTECRTPTTAPSQMPSQGPSTTQMPSQEPSTSPTTAEPTNAPSPFSDYIIGLIFDVKANVGDPSDGDEGETKKALRRLEKTLDAALAGNVTSAIKTAARASESLGCPSSDPICEELGDILIALSKQMYAP